MMTGADSIRRITPGIPLPARHAETSVKQSPAMMKTCPPHPVNRHRNKSRSTLILKAFLVALFLSAGAPWVPADDEEADAISDDPDVPAWLEGGSRIWEPEEAIEVRFAEAMVGSEEVGQKAARSPLVTTPEWPGEFVWRSRSSGVWLPREPLRIGAKVVLTLAGGMSTAAGNELPELELGVLSGPAFEVVARQPEWMRHYDASREPSLLLQFSADVDPAVMQRSVVFTSAERQIVPAVVRHATGADWDRYSVPVATLRQRFEGVAPELPGDDEIRLDTVVIVPTRPLPAGQDWRLHLAEGMPASEGGPSLAAAYEANVGNVIEFQVAATSASTPYDLQPRVRIMLSKEPDPELEAEQVAPLVTVSPQPEDMRVSLEGRWLLVTGEFELGAECEVGLAPGLVARDGLVMEKAHQSKVVFSANPGYLALPAFSTGQLARGQREFRAVMANVEGMRLRIKAVPLNHVPVALSEYSRYGVRGWGANERFDTVDFDEIPGDVVADWNIANPQTRTNHSHVHVFNWDDVPRADQAGALLIHAEAVTKADVDEKQPVLVAQSLVQLSDLGLTVKAGLMGEGVVQVFSVVESEPLEGVEVRALDAEGALLAEGRTGGSGTVLLPLADARWVVASRGDDTFVMDREVRAFQMDSWRFGVPTSWGAELRPKVYLFTERPLYFPGDTVFVKGIVRELNEEEAWRMPTDGAGVELVLNDPNGREVSRSQHTLSSFGTFDTEIELPLGRLGGYSLQATVTSADRPDEFEGQGWAMLQVEEFRPNTFEVGFESVEFLDDGTRVAFDLEGNYLMGRPLARAEVGWTVSVSEATFQPDGFEGYAFGDFGEDNWWGWSPWYHWDEEDYGGWDEGEIVGWGDTMLDLDGRGRVETQVPAFGEVLGPRNMAFRATVTDINQQTITARRNVRVDSSAFYLGVKRPDWLSSAGDTLTLGAVALAPDGSAWTSAVEARVEVHRRVWNPVREVLAGGGSRIRHQEVRVQVMESSVVLEPGEGGATAAAGIELNLRDGGSYEVLLTATDPQGRAVSTRFGFYLHGGDAFGWRMREGTIIELEPEQRSYGPGDTARVMVKTPFEGPALVTVERAGVRRHFTTGLSPENSLIEVPLEEGDAPNVFVSVVQIRTDNRGGEAAPVGGEAEGEAEGEDPPVVDEAPAVIRPAYRIGVCQIRVESERHLLEVVTGIGRSEALPGEAVTASARVLDGAGGPVQGAEVTLFAVDEGILSLMPRSQPDPVAEFHGPRPLGVSSFVNLSGFLGEDPDELRLQNKGRVIGGGGMDELMLDPARLREDFRACAFWVGSSVTDANGEVTAEFDVPDSLTRFKIVAVALADADRFGVGSDQFTVRKPLMLEPVVPRFANLGDEIRLRAVVHNDTGEDRAFKVSLAADEHVEALDAGDAGVGGSTLERLVRVADGARGTVEFNVRFVNMGEAAWTWSAVVDGEDADAAFVDNVVSRFKVGSPVPLLRDREFVTVKEAADLREALRALDPALLEGDGVVRVSLSTSRAFQAAEGMEYLLHYPYGCLEQTLSSLLPWLAVTELGPVFPELAARVDEAPKVIQKGVDRILGMQGWHGGMGYWSGSDSANLWGSAYAGIALALALESGARVPDEAMDQLHEYLRQQLQNLLEQQDDDVRTDQVMALYALARAGRAEVGFHNALIDGGKVSGLPEVSRLWLGLAMLEAGQEKQHVKAMLETPYDEKVEARRFWISHVEEALAAMLWTRMDPESQQATDAFDRLFDRRGERGWGSTYANAWTLLALRENVRHEDLPGGATVVKVTIGAEEQDEQLLLAAGLSSAAGEWDLGKGLPTFELPDAVRLYAMVEVQARPRNLVAEQQRHGFSLRRTYHVLNPDGSRIEVDEDTVLTVGDMVLVELEFEGGDGNRFVALDDALPATFEALNPAFATAGAAQGGQDWSWWGTDFRELRTDRALFFQNTWNAGTYRLQYSARVIAEGDVTAPPARIEAMYQPDIHGLSPSFRVRSQLRGADARALAR